MRAFGPYEGKRRLVVGPYSIVYEYDAEHGVVSVIAVARGVRCFADAGGVEAAQATGALPALDMSGASRVFTQRLAGLPTLTSRGRRFDLYCAHQTCDCDGRVGVTCSVAG